MIVLGLDPGTYQSAFVLWGDDGKIWDHGIHDNERILAFIAGDENSYAADWARNGRESAILAIEAIQSFGMPVGKETFRTVFWTGRFAQAWSPRRFVEVTRKEVKLHLCQSHRATDANIRAALIDRFGPPGVKSQKGLLYGLKGHEYAALAVAVTFYDQHAGELRPGVTAAF